jgi:hypothetical protein
LRVVEFSISEKRIVTVPSGAALGSCIPVLSESQIERVQLNGLAIFNQEAVAVVDILRCDIVGSLRLFQ